MTRSPHLRTGLALMLLAACIAGCPGPEPEPGIEELQGWNVQASTMAGLTAGPHAVFALDADHAFAAGNAGEILVTTNGGQSATPAETGVTDNLHGIAFSSSTTGWAVGELGRILLTTDGGATWDQFTIDMEDVPQYALHLDDVYARGALVCIVGWNGFIATSGDGGQSFWIVYEGATDVHRVTFTDERRGWAVGAGGLMLATTNAGEDWEELPSGVETTLRGITFVPGSSTEGWAVGDEGTLLHTTDGSTWTRQQLQPSVMFFDVRFVDRRTGWIVGDEGTILHTADGGGTWTRQQSPSQAPLEAIAMVNAEHGWIVGANPGRNAGLGVVLHTATGGE